MTATLFLCIGFMMAVLYVDLMFDVMSASHRGAAVLPPEVLDPITHYYGRITRNPFVLIFVMFTATSCLVAEVAYGLVPKWASYSSLFFMGLSLLTGTLKVIPTAQRLGSGRESAEARTRIVRGLLPFHLVLLINILILAAIQFAAIVIPR